MRFAFTTHNGPADPKSDPEAGPETDPETDPDANIEVDPEPDPEADPMNLKTDPEADPASDLKAEPEADGAAPNQHHHAQPAPPPRDTDDLEPIPMPTPTESTDGIIVEGPPEDPAGRAAEKTNGGRRPEEADAEYPVMSRRECTARRPDGSTIMFATALEPRPWHTAESYHQLVTRDLPDDVHTTTSTPRPPGQPSTQQTPADKKLDGHKEAHQRLMSELIKVRPRHDKRDAVRWCPHRGRAIKATHEATLALHDVLLGRLHRELLTTRPRADITAYLRCKHIRWRAQIKDTRSLLLRELRMRTCGSDEVLEAKDDHSWALSRLPAYAIAAIQSRRRWRKSPPSGNPPPSPAPSPPDSPDEDGEPSHSAEGGPSHERHEETAGPSAAATPSPPPSPPQPLARRLDLLMTAEDAVANTYAYPNYPARFLEDVQPHITRYIISEGKQPVQAGVRAVYAVLIKSDERNDASTDLEVSSTLLAPARTFRRWKATIDTLRAESTDAASLLDLAGEPPVSAPPSPAASEVGDIEELANTFADLLHSGKIHEGDEAPLEPWTRAQKKEPVDHEWDAAAVWQEWHDLYCALATCNDSPNLGELAADGPTFDSIAAELSPYLQDTELEGDPPPDSERQTNDDLRSARRAHPAAQPAPPTRHTPRVQRRDKPGTHTGGRAGRPRARPKPQGGTTRGTGRDPATRTRHKSSAKPRTHRPPAPRLRSSVYDATTAIDPARCGNPSTPPRSSHGAELGSPRTAAEPRSTARCGREGARGRALPNLSLGRLSKRRMAPPSTRPAAARRPRRAPPATKPGPMRHDRVHERRRRKAAMYLAIRRRAGPPKPTAPSITTSVGAGCSSDPLVPHGKYDYGNEIVRYWDGLAVSAEPAPDPDGHGNGLRYTGAQQLERARLVGVYLADIKVTARALRIRTETTPLHGEHAIESCGWALLDKQGRSAISRANESSRPNVELTEIDVFPDGDEPSFTLLGMISIATIRPGDWLTTDYGPVYEGVRAARGYKRPYNHARDGHAVRWLTSAELDQREHILRDALSPWQLAHAQRWGGILDHAGKAGTRSDPNRARGLPMGPATPPPPAPSPPASPPASERDEDEEIEEIEEVEVELEEEPEIIVLEVVVDTWAPRTPTALPAPELSTMASNTAVASPSASTPLSAGGTLGARAHASLEWAGRGPAPRGLEVIYLAAGTTRLITARNPELDGDDWGGTYNIYVSPPNTAEAGWPPDYEVYITSGRRHPRGQDEPTLLISWLSAWGRPTSSGSYEPAITTMEASARNTFGVEKSRLSHGEIIAYGTPSVGWSGSTHLTPHLATTRLDWAFRLNVSSEPPLVPGLPGWPRRPPLSTPGSSEPGRRQQTSHLLFEASGSDADEYAEWARRFIASPTATNETDGGAPSTPASSGTGKRGAPQWPPPPSPPTSPPASEDEEEAEAQASDHVTTAPHHSAQDTAITPPPPTPSRQLRPTCKLEGCTRPCYPRGTTTPGTHDEAGEEGWHDYCGRTHAHIAIAERRAPNPLAPICAIDGCERNAWRRSDAEGGGYHRCCGRQCALRLAAASSKAAWAAAEAAASQQTGPFTREPIGAGGPIDTERALTEEERQAGKQRLNTASSGPSPFVERKRRPSGGAHETPGRTPRKRRSHRSSAAARLARRIANIEMATRRTCTSYVMDADEATACVTDGYVDNLISELNSLTDNGAEVAIAAALAPLRANYDDTAWEDMGRQREAYLSSRTASADWRASGPKADCSSCGALGTVAATRRRLGGCLCGGGVCATCGTDTCACPWDGSTPAPPMPNSATLQRNATEWTFVELPLDDPYAPTILLMGDASGAMAKACAHAFPAELCLAVDYRTRRHVKYGLYWCGDVRDVLWRQRWRLIIAHPDCASAAMSNTIGKEARIDSGELWWAMAFAVMLYCAPAEIAIIEQPTSVLAQAWRPPDTSMQFLDYGVGFSKHWCIWRRGGAGSFSASTPTTPGALADAQPTHRIRHSDRDEQKRLRSETPPEMAAALCATIHVRSGSTWHQPLYHEEVEILAAGYRRHTGREPPAGYAEPTAQPLDPSDRRAPRAPPGTGLRANRPMHPLAQLPLKRGACAAEARLRRTAQERRHDASDHTAAHDRGAHGEHRASTHTRRTATPQRTAATQSHGTNADPPPRGEFPDAHRPAWAEAIPGCKPHGAHADEPARPNPHATRARREHWRDCVPHPLPPSPLAGAHIAHKADTSAPNIDEAETAATAPDAAPHAYTTASEAMAAPADDRSPPQGKAAATARDADTTAAIGSATKRRPAPPPLGDERARQRRWRFDTPKGSVAIAQRDGDGAYAHGRPTEWCIDVGRGKKGSMAGRHLLSYMPDASRRYLGLALQARRLDATRQSDGEQPEAGSLLAALGFTLPLAAGTKALLDKPGETEAVAALDQIAQQISEGRCLTLVDSEPHERGAAAPLATWLRRRAHDLREADDALARRSLRQQHAPPTAPTSDETATPGHGARVWAEIIGETPEGDTPTTTTPTEAQTTGAGDDGAAAKTAPTINVDSALAPTKRRIVLVAVTHHPDPAGGARFLAHLPPQRNALYGVTEETSQSRRRREAMCEMTFDWLDLGCPQEAYFHAGDVQTHVEPHPDHPGDDPLDPRAMRTIVFTALLVRLPDDARLADSSPDDAHENTPTGKGTWWTLDQLATAATCPAGTARYRACAAAIAKVDSYMQPTGDTPHFLRWGVRPEANANSSAAEHATAATGLEARLEAAAATATEFQKILESVRTTGTGEGDGHAEFAHALAPLVDTTPGATLPAELLPLAPPAPPEDAALRPFRHTAVIFATDPLPAPESQTAPEDGFWPHDVQDIVEGWALKEIRAWLAACLEWHRSGGPAHGRPHPIAFGEDAIKPRARGRLWDLRGGPGNVKLFDPATEPKRTGLDLEFAAAEFADIPDRELISMICDGVQMKTEHMAHQIVLMPNLLSLYSENGGVKAAAGQMAEMQKLGFLATFSQLPCVPFRAMPRGVVPKKGTDELRGIGDQGQPRKSLLTRRTSEPVVPLNELSREGEWSHQNMDSLETASHNSAVLLALADLNGESMVDMAFDFSKFFHQLFYYALLLWQMGAIVPRRGGDDGNEDVLDFALEYVMTMGATPSSQVAQRFANAIAAAICRRMNALEASRWRDPRLQHELSTSARNALALRAKLPPTCYGTQAALFNVLIYCDDARLACVGAERAARLLRVFHDVVGKRGLRLPLSRADKQQTGVGVVWLGAHLSSALGLVWVPKDKAAKAAAALRSTLRGELTVGDYRRLLGYLVSLLFMVGGDKGLLHHIFRPIKPGEEIDAGPATLVTVDELMRVVLQRWLALIMDVPGASMLAAFSPIPPPATTTRHRIRADAALEGTPSPGLGGWLYGHWFAVAIADQPGLERLDIPHLEFIAAGLSIITFAGLLTGASLICIETDALATATNLTRRAKTPAMQVILDALLASPSYNEIAPRLRVAHCSGAGNPMADAASRGYASTLAALSEALGVTSTQVPIPDEARAFMQRAIDGMKPIATARERREPTEKPVQAIERTLTEEERQAGRQRLNSASSGPSPYVERVAAATGPIGMPAAATDPPPPRPGSALRMHLGRTPPHTPGDGAREGARVTVIPSTPPWQRSHWQRDLAAEVARRNSASGATPPPPPSLDAARAAHKHGADRTPPSFTPPHPKRERVVHVPDTPQPSAPPPSAAPQPPPRPQPAAPDLGDADDVPRALRHATLDTPPGTPDSTAPTRLAFGRAALSPEGRPPQEAEEDSWLDPRLARAPTRTVHMPERRETCSAPRAVERAVGGHNARVLREDRTSLADRAYEKLRNDKSEYAVRADDDVVRWLADVATQGDPGQAPLTTQAQRGSNWKWWKRYCAYLGLSSPWRPDAATLDADGQQREAAIWAGALMWIYGRMQPRKGRFLPEGPPHFGKPKPPSPLSALAILRGVRAEHVARGITPPSLALATRRAHEQMLKYSREIGPENCVPQRAIPMTHELICKMLLIPDGECILKSCKPWHWFTSYGISLRTAIHVLSQCGFRKAEIALGLGKWGPEKMSFASLMWLINGEIVVNPTPEQLRSLRKGDYAIIMPGASKADCFGMKWGNNPIWLPFDPDAAINAAYALSVWELHAEVKPDDRRNTPLFCGPDGVGTPLRSAALDELFFRMMSYVTGNEAQAKKYSIHGFRSYLASALLAAGCSGPEIQAALRWASDESLKVYQVIQRETYGGWLIAAEQVKLTGARASSLHAEGRHLPVYEPESMLADALGTREELRSRAEHADNADMTIIRSLGVEGVVDEEDA